MIRAAERSCRNINKHSSVCKLIKKKSSCHSYQNLDFNNQSESMQRGIFNLDFYGNIKSIFWEWLNPDSVIRSLDHLEHVKGSRVFLFYTGVWFFFAKELMAVLYLLWLNDLAGPSRLLCYVPQIAAITQNLCSEMSASCLKVLVQSHLLRIFPKPTLSCETCLVSPRSDDKSAALWAFPQKDSCGRRLGAWDFPGEWAFFYLAPGFSQCLV